MTRTAVDDGALAFGRDERRTTNPFDAGSEEWMCWRDGWEQAKASAERAPASSGESGAGAPGS